MVQGLQKTMNVVTISFCEAMQLHLHPAEQDIK